MVASTLGPANSTALERDASLINAERHDVRPGDIAVGGIIGRPTEVFDFFVYAIAAVRAFRSLILTDLSQVTGTAYSIANYAPCCAVSLYYV